MNKKIILGIKDTSYKLTDQVNLFLCVNYKKIRIKSNL